MKNFFHFRNPSIHIFGRKFKTIYFAVLILLVTTATVMAAISCSTLLSRKSLPESAILIALGHDSKTAPLRSFADHVEKKIHRRVVTYKQFSDAHYISKTGKWWHDQPANVTALVEQALLRAAVQYPNQKIIVFNLDGYDPKELFDQKGNLVWSYTNFEVSLILRNQILFLATRWYKNGRELTEEEAEALWDPIIAVLLSKKQLGYGP